LVKIKATAAAASVLNQSQSSEEAGTVRSAAKGMAFANSVRENIGLLSELHTLHGRKRQQRLQQLSPREVDFVCDCAYNILNQNIPLSRDQLELLRKPKYKRALRVAADRNAPFQTRRRVLTKQQTGGIIPAVLAFLAPVLGSVLGSAIAG
jgi:hypothetical protein